MQRGVQQYSVAGCQSSCQRQKAKLQGIVPWRDNQHHSVSLRHSVCLGRKEAQAAMNSLFATPMFQVFELITYLGEDYACFGHVTFFPALVQVFKECLFNLIKVAQNHRAKMFQCLYAFFDCNRRHLS